MSDTAKHLQELQEAEASLKAAFENYRTVALRANASLPSKPPPPSPSSSEADGATPGPWEAHQQDRERIIAFEQSRRLGEATPFDHRREILATTAAQLAKTLNEVSANGPHLALAEAAATFRHELTCIANALAELRRQERAAS